MRPSGRCINEDHEISKRPTRWVYWSTDVALYPFQKVYCFLSHFNWWWPNNEFSLWTCYTREILRDNSSFFQCVSICIQYQFSHHVWTGMAKPVVPKSEILGEHFVHRGISLYHTDLGIVKISRECRYSFDNFSMALGDFSNLKELLFPLPIVSIWKPFLYLLNSMGFYGWI